MKTRGFEKVSAYAEVDFPLPRRQTARSAGYDFTLPKTVTIAPGERMLLPLGVKAYMQPDEYLGIHIRSSMAIKRGLQLLNNVGIVDSDYYNNPDNEGHIMLALRNTTDAPVTLQAGERVCQGIFYKFYTADDDRPVKDDREGGFGSTGK